MHAVCPHVFFQKRKNNLSREKSNLSKMLPTLIPISDDLKLLIKKKNHNETDFLLTLFNRAFYSDYLREVKTHPLRYKTF